MSTPNTLSMEVQVDPPFTVVTARETELAVRIELRVDPEARLPPVRLQVAVVTVGSPAGAPAEGLRAGLTALVGRLRPGDRVDFVGAGRFEIGDGGDATAALGGVEAALIASESNLASALVKGLDALDDPVEDGVARRLFVVLKGMPPEPLDALLQAAAALSERRLGIEVFCMTPGADLGLLTRLANLGGGEVVSVDAVAGLAPALERRVEILQRQCASCAGLAVRLAPTVLPGRLYRVEPGPVFLGKIRLADGRVLIDPGPIVAGRAHAFVFTVQVPKRPAGRYQLGTVALLNRAAGETPLTSASIPYSCTTDPLESRLVDPRVRAALDRVEPTAWVEEVARAFAEGDHRRVANTLDQILRRGVELRRKEVVDTVAGLRRAYLRSGMLDRDDLNRLRRFASTWS